jgi:hypothetical protein
MAKCHVRRSGDNSTRKCPQAERGHVLVRDALFSTGPGCTSERILPYTGLAELEKRPPAIRRPTGFPEQQ